MKIILLTLLLLTAYTTKGQSDSIAGESLKMAAILKGVSGVSLALVPVLIKEQTNRTISGNQQDIKPVIIFFGFVAVVTHIASIVYEYKAGEALKPKRKY